MPSLEDVPIDVVVDDDEIIVSVVSVVSVISPCVVSTNVVPQTGVVASS